MNNEGISLDEALQKAKELGFAEADATADLEGLDMLRKICILSSIAYGGYVPYSSIYHYGITKVTKEILDGIKNQGYVLKFVAESRLDNGNVKIAVEPVLVTNKNPLSGVSYEFNAVYYQASTNDLLGFYGKGAGKFPTATAMVADIQRILSKSEKYYFENNNSFSVSNFTKDADYYVVENGVGKITKGLEKCACEYDFVARIFD
jgi:homoserine dehydrogenase